jgi:hypothetical protein
MLRTIIFLFFLIPFVAIGQNDVLVLKKRGYHLRSYTIGDELTMKSVYDQWLSGTITGMRNDTIFLNGNPFNYKEIAAIRRSHANFGNTTLPFGMMGSGFGIFFLGAFNGLYRHDQAKDWYTKSGVITGASLLVIGYALTFTKTKTYRMGRRYKLDYLQLTFNKKPASR